MSHFTQIKTSIRDLSTLKSVLTELDLSWEKINMPIKGYKNEISNAELIIQQSNSIDTGFIFNDQSYELVVDESFWHQSCSIELLLKKINQDYAIQVLDLQLKNIGFSTINCVKAEQGTIDITAEKFML
mmetsp:Transcript_6414/g.20825  ORF Transcript_6414/g.20825 Transcript_6414/m.20825 type:complete len:129 (+) Transcript_6414:81-467(+)